VKGLLQRAVPVAALIVSILLTAFHALPPRHSTGYFVKLAPAHCPAEDSSDADRLVILRIINTGATYINSEQVYGKGLQTGLSEIYSQRFHPNLYLAAEDGIPFQKMADVLDIVQGNRSDVPIQGRDYLGIRVKIDNASSA
jgi:biopolymer transport protein ExbD